MEKENTTIQQPGGNFAMFQSPQNNNSKSMEKHRKFPVLVYLGSGISILLVIIIGAVSLHFSRQQKGKELLVEHSYMVLDDAESLHKGLYEMEISRLGYNSTPGLVFFKQYHTSSIIMFSGLNTLTSLVKDNPNQLLRVNRLRRQIDSLLNFWQLQNIAPANKLNNSGKRLFLLEKAKLDGIGATISDIVAAEHQLLIQREEGDRALRQKTNFAIIAGTSLILLIVSLLIYLTLRELKYRIVAYEKENEMNRLKSSFVSLASHEFRTPLSTIMLSTELVEKYVEVLSDERISKQTHKIKAAINNLKLILEDFLSIEKLNSGKIKARLESFDLVTLCENIIEEMTPILKTGQQLRFEQRGVQSLVLLDENLMRNAIINLVSNAIKYAGDAAVIELSAEISGERVYVSVKDDGVGIAEKDQKDLFSPFYRINHTGKIPGTGLGLNIVQHYVSLMNGTITFQSKPMHGTSFRMSFPR